MGIQKLKLGVVGVAVLATNFQQHGSVGFFIRKLDKGFLLRLSQGPPLVTENGHELSKTCVGVLLGKVRPYGNLKHKVGRSGLSRWLGIVTVPIRICAAFYNHVVGTILIGQLSKIFHGQGRKVEVFVRIEIKILFFLFGFGIVYKNMTDEKIKRLALMIVSFME